MLINIWVVVARGRSWWLVVGRGGLWWFVVARGGSYVLIDLITFPSAKKYNIIKEYFDNFIYQFFKLLKFCLTDIISFRENRKDKPCALVSDQ